MTERETCKTCRFVNVETYEGSTPNQQYYIDEPALRIEFPVWWRIIHRKRFRKRGCPAWLRHRYPPTPTTDVWGHQCHWKPSPVDVSEDHWCGEHKPNTNPQAHNTT